MSEFGLDSKIVIDETIMGQDVRGLKSFITDKNYPFVSDQQNGSYSNQVSFDLSGIVSNNAYLNLQNSYILMPMSASLNSTAAWGTDSIPPSAVVPKSNFLNLIDSIQVFVNNKQLVDQTTMMNLPVSILSKLEMSTADLKLEGKGLGICPDTYSAVSYSAAASASGDGYVNNETDLVSSTLSTSAISQNKGAFDRISSFVNCSPFVSPSQKLPSIKTVDSTNATTKIATQKQRAVAAADQGLPYFTLGATNSTTLNDTQAAAWNFIAYIPLRRLCDLFARMPLIKNSQVRLVLNLNLGSVVITNASGVVSLASTNMTAGNTFPLMFNNQSSNATFPTSGTTTLSLSVQANTAPPTLNPAIGCSYGYPMLPQCRLFCQSISVAPNYEEKILANRTQTVRYLDWFQMSINNVAAGSSYSQTVSTSLPNVACAVVVPFQASASTIFATATGVDQYKSPFDAAPEQSLPLGMAAFKQLNFQVNGSNVWTNNHQFTYDQFAQEVKSLSLNGSLKRELASGLMDLTDWQYSPFAICDLGDRIDAEVDAYQSVVINGTNGAAVAVDLKVFVGYWKTYTIDVLTGQMEKVF